MSFSRSQKICQTGNFTNMFWVISQCLTTRSSSLASVGDILMEHQFEIRMKLGFFFFFFLFYHSFLQYAWHYLRITGVTDWHQFIGFYSRKQQSRSTSSDILDRGHQKHFCQYESFTLYHFPSHEHQWSFFHPHWHLTHVRQHCYSAEILVEVHIRSTWLKQLKSVCQWAVWTLGRKP